MEKRRVVVTGLGTVNPLGNTVAESWAAAKAGQCGIAPITQFDTAGFKCKLAAEVKGFDPEAIVDKKELRKMARFTLLALAAATEAIQDSGLDTEANAKTTGVILSSGIGGLPTIEEQHTRGEEKGKMCIRDSLLTGQGVGVFTHGTGFGHGSALPSAQGDAGIVPAKAQTVAQCVGHVLGAAHVRHIVQVALRVGLRVMDGGRGKLVPQGQRREHGFHAARAAQQVAGHALGAHDGQLLGVLPEHRVDGSGLAGVVHMGAGAVGVDVVHLFRGDAGVGQGLLHAVDGTCLLYTSAESDLDDIKGKGKMVIGYTVYEPMNYTDADGSFTGFDTELATAEMCIRDSTYSTSGSSCDP